jgi:predicted  nucleic acid-binding Zn-ribbon protein
MNFRYRWSQAHSQARNEKVTETDITHAMAIADSLRKRLDGLRREREWLRQKQEDLLAEPRAHAEILADIDQALAAASQEMSEKAERIIQRLADTRPWNPRELAGAVSGLIGKKVSAGGFVHFVADPSALVVLLAPQIRDLLTAKLENTAPGIPTEERAERLEAVRAELAATETKIRDTLAVAKRTGLDLSSRRAA